MAAIDNTGPLLARSMAEAVLLITVYIALPPGPWLRLESPGW